MPVLTSIGSRNVQEGSNLAFSVSASDADGDALTFGASNLPSGATFTGNAFSWTPSFTQSGTYSVTFTVNDVNGASDSETVSITVGNVNQPPALTLPTSITVREGQTAVINPVATDVDGDAITFSVSDSRFTQVASDRFEWDTWYDNEGAFFVTVTASTPDGKSVSQQVRIVVKNVKIDHPDVEIETAVILNSGGVVRPGEALEFYLNVKNNGNTDDEDTRITLLISELGITSDLGMFSLDVGNKYSDLVQVPLPYNTVPGKEYFYILKAESDDAEDIKYGSFLTF